MAFAGSKRRVFPLQVQTALSPDAPEGVASASASAAQRSLLPPKSPLHGARASAAATGGFERMLLLRNMNVSVPVSGVDVHSTASIKPTLTPVVTASAFAAEEVSAAHNLKERKLAEARRRVEVQLMAFEDYTNTPEGEARLRRQDERARMREEELRMQRVVQHEQAQRRALLLQQQAEEETRIKEMYLAKRRQEMEEQARLAQEKDAARKQALEAKMKALKEEADRRAREEYAARQKKLADEAQAERDIRTAATETTLMHVEDELATVMRVEWLAEQERLRQIEAEALEWKLFEEREAERQREETQRRRDAQKEQYEQDRARRMQIHKLQQERVRTAADKKRRDHEQQGEATAKASASLERLRSQCEQVADVPPILLPPPSSSPSSASTRPLTETTARDPPPTARRLKVSLDTSRNSVPTTAATLDTVTEQMIVPPPPTLTALDLDVEPPCTSTCSDTKDPSDTGQIPEEKGNAPPSLNEAECGESPLATETREGQDPPPESVVSQPPGSRAESLSSPLPPLGEKEGESSTSHILAVNETSLPPADAILNEEVPCVIQPDLLSLNTLKQDGVTPVAEVLNVTSGSPSSVAGLLPRDLLIEFGGIISTTPKCIVAIADCVQQNVNKKIPLVVLRPAEGTSGELNGEVMVHRCELWLTPQKWKGKGLLGCQLSPFKWAAPVSTSHESETESSRNGSTAGTAYDALLFHEVKPGSLAQDLGILDGDVLARCGDLDVTRAGTTTSEALDAVASHMEREWKTVERELPIVIQRWDENAQAYIVVHMVLPVPAGRSLGCTLTTYSEYYYPSTTIAQSTPACDECYYSSLASSLHAAALSGHVACLQALLAACNPEFFDWRDDEGRSPLFYACYARQIDAARCLITQLLASTGPYDPVSGADAYGDSPLHAAASSDCLAAIECLLDSQFITDVNLVNSVSHATPAHVAASEASLRLLHARFGADVLALDADGRMPLFYACLRNDPASVSYLGELYPDFTDYADSAGGNTPLHMAAWCGYHEVVRALLAWLPGIALFVPNQDGLDARTLAEQSGWWEIAQELERLMAGT